MTASLEYQDDDGYLLIRPWGPHAVRVTAAPSAPALDGRPNGLLVEPPPTEADAHGDRLTVGGLSVERLADGRLRFSRDAAVVLEEKAGTTYLEGPRAFRHVGGGMVHATVAFEAFPGERLHGLGQHQHGRLDQKGLVIDLLQRNTQVAVPFLLSNRGYGLMWNVPSLGRVELGESATRWVAERTPAIDYWITAGTDPMSILQRFVAVTGGIPPFPDWATGHWQSKLRYRTQDEVLEVARGFAERGLPLDALVVDFFHWEHFGDWAFDPTAFPDPAAMVEELRRGGIEPVVSVWPMLAPDGAHRAAFEEAGWLATVEGDAAPVMHFVDTGQLAVDLAVYDPFHPAAREGLAQALQAGYRDHGIEAFWLDACEPEVNLHAPHDLQYRAGTGTEVGLAYPAAHQQGIADVLQPEVMLSRSAWFGSQAAGALVWSGDVASTWEALGAQVRAGLNAAMSGLAWWTTDIGGFHGGDPDDPGFRELLVRWFEFGVFCPVTRLHGLREPKDGWDTGGPNEPWSFGPEVEGLVRRLMDVRQALRPYVRTCFEEAHVSGAPLLRSMWLAFPDDPEAETLDDQYLFGPDLLVAPVLAPGQRRRDVYLPEAGASWISLWDATEQLPAGWHTCDAPPGRPPVFVRPGSEVTIHAGGA